jgi:hypothetical protein
VGGAPSGGLGDAGPESARMIGADTSVLVRYLIGSPREQARRAARTMDSNEVVGITLSRSPNAPTCCERSTACRSGTSSRA